MKLFGWLNEPVWAACETNVQAFVECCPRRSSWLPKVLELFSMIIGFFISNVRMDRLDSLREGSKGQRGDYSDCVAQPKGIIGIIINDFSVVCSTRFQFFIRGSIWRHSSPLPSKTSADLPSNNTLTQTPRMVFVISISSLQLSQHHTSQTFPCQGFSRMLGNGGGHWWLKMIMGLLLGVNSFGKLRKFFDTLVIGWTF